MSDAAESAAPAYSLLRAALLGALAFLVLAIADGAQAPGATPPVTAVSAAAAEALPPASVTSSVVIGTLADNSCAPPSGSPPCGTPHRERKKSSTALVVPTLSVQSSAGFGNASESVRSRTTLTPSGKVKIHSDGTIDGSVTCHGRAIDHVCPGGEQTAAFVYAHGAVDVNGSVTASGRVPYSVDATLHASGQSKAPCAGVTLAITGAQPVQSLKVTGPAAGDPGCTGTPSSKTLHRVGVVQANGTIDVALHADTAFIDPGTTRTDHLHADWDVTVTFDLRPCVPEIRVGFTVAVGCFRETAAGSGVYETIDPVDIGGFQLRPRSDTVIELRTVSPVGLHASGGVDLLVGSRLVPFPVSLLPVGFAQPEIALGTTGTVTRILGSAIMQALGFKDFPLSAKLKVKWATDGRSSVISGEVKVDDLMKAFGVLSTPPANAGLGAGSGAGSSLPAFGGGGGGFSLNAANGSGFSVASLTVEVARIGLIVQPGDQLIGIDSFKLAYTVTNNVPMLVGDVRIGIPRGGSSASVGVAPGGAPAPSPLILAARLRMVDGAIAGAGLGVDGLQKPLGDTGIFFQGLFGELATKPTVGFSVVGNGTFLPKVGNDSILEGTIELDGFGLAADCTTSTKPIELKSTVSSSVLEHHGFGKVTGEAVYCVYFGSPVAEVSQTVDLRLDVGGIEGVMGVKGTASGWIGLGAMNVEGTGTINLPLGPDIGGTLVVSSAGYAACAQIGWLLGGFGGTWTSTPQTFTACDLGPWRATVPVFAARSIAGSVHASDVAAGLPLVAFAARGQGLVPRAALVGPGGVRFDAPADGHLVVTNDVVIATSPPEHAVFFVVRKPAAGAWHVETIDAAAPVATVATADGLADPHLQATVTRKGRQVVLLSTFTARAGLTVRLVERAGELRKPLATVSQGGTITFTPLPARTPAHTIEAELAQDGIPLPTRVIASFTVPKPQPPATVRALKAKRAGKKLRIRFALAARADRYLVEVRDPRHRGVVVLASRGDVTIIGVPAGRLVIRVTAISDVAGRGRPATVRLAR